MTKLINDYIGTQLARPIDLLERDLKNNFRARRCSGWTQVGTTLLWWRYQVDNRYYFIIVVAEHHSYNIRWYRVVKKYFPKARLDAAMHNTDSFESTDGGSNTTCFILPHIEAITTL